MNHTISGVNDRWSEGTTVHVYAQDSFGAQTGSSLANAAVSSDAVTFTGLSYNTKYVASDGTKSQRFSTVTDPALAAVTQADLTTAAAGKQDLDSDLTAIAALTTTSAGRSILDDADAPAIRSTIGALADTDARVVNRRSESYGFWPWDVPPTSSQSYGTANLQLYIRFLCTRSITATGMTLGVTVGAGADDQYDVGILSADGTTVLASSGAGNPVSHKLNATGIKSRTFTSSVALVAGTVYYACFCAALGGTAPTLTAYNHASGTVATMASQTPGTIDAVASWGGRANGAVALGTGLPSSTTTSWAPGVFIRGT